MMAQSCLSIYSFSCQTPAAKAYRELVGDVADLKAGHAPTT